jgi:hypothetical protein
MFVCVYCVVYCDWRRRGIRWRLGHVLGRSILQYVLLLLLLFFAGVISGTYSFPSSVFGYKMHTHPIKWNLTWTYVELPCTPMNPCPQCSDHQLPRLLTQDMTIQIPSQGPCTSSRVKLSICGKISLSSFSLREAVQGGGGGSH